MKFKNGALLNFLLVTLAYAFLVLMVSTVVSLKTEEIERSIGGTLVLDRTSTPRGEMMIVPENVYISVHSCENLEATLFAESMDVTKTDNPEQKAVYGCGEEKYYYTARHTTTGGMILNGTNVNAKFVFVGENSEDFKISILYAPWSPLEVFSNPPLGLILLWGFIMLLTLGLNVEYVKKEE